MNRNRTTAAVVTFFAVIALALGTVFAIGGGSGDDGPAPVAADVEQDTATGSDIEDDADVLIGRDGSDVLIGGDDDSDVLIGGDDGSDVLIGDGEDELLGGGEDLLLDPQPERPGISRFCVNVEHQPVPDQNAASGIWVRGEVYGLDGGWIWVQGPTLNNGDPVQLPVSDGSFEGPLGINSYGDHPFERFDLVPTEDGSDPIDLLPTLDSGPGRQVPVTGSEGPAFDSECFDLEPPVAAEEMVEDVPTADLPADVEAAAGPAPDQLVREFLDGFVADHVTGDVDGLLDTLHPAIPLAFGETECDAYVTGTTGSLVGAEVRSVGQLTDVDLDTPSGPITITDVIPFEVEFMLLDGSTMSNEANLAVLDGEPHWLTRCGR